MPGRLSRSGAEPWLVVVGVGLVVLVVGVGLFARFGAGEELLDGARPAFEEERVAGATAGVGMVSTIVDSLDPIATRKGGAAGELPKLVSFVARRSGTSRRAVRSALRRRFPHAGALLQAVPLSAVRRELPRFVSFVTLEATTVTPRLGQSILALPAVTDGWSRVRRAEELTRFDGRPATTAPEVSDYFSADLVPLLGRQRLNFEHLDTYPPPLVSIPLMLLLVAVVLIGFSLLMIGSPLLRDLPVSWTVVSAVGAIAVVLLFAFRLFPALGDGQELVDHAAPAFSEERVAGARGGIDFLSKVVDLADPIATGRGGAAGERPELLAFAARRTGLSRREVRASLRREFPHTSALLAAIPLSEVSRELPRLRRFLAKRLRMPLPRADRTLRRRFPRLSQTIAALPAVTRGWNRVPGTRRLTRFDGRPARTVPEVREYLSADVVGLFERQRANFERLDGFPSLALLPLLLLGLGLALIVYGAAMALLAGRSGTAGA